jgi:hypothetical protein
MDVDHVPRIGGSLRGEPEAVHWSDELRRQYLQKWHLQHLPLIPFPSDNLLFKLSEVRLLYPDPTALETERLHNFFYLINVPF